MRIAFFTNTILEHGGGLEKYFIEAASFLQRRYPRAEITVFTFNEKRTEALQRLLSCYYFKPMPIANIYRESTESIRKKLGGVRYVKCGSFSELKNRLQDQDILYSKNEILDLSMLAWLGFHKLPPVVAGIHTPIAYPIAASFHSRLHNFLYTGWLYKALLRRVRGLHVINEATARLLREMGYGGRVEKISNPYTGVFPELQGRPIETFRIAFIGRLSKEKGLDIFLECIEALSREAFFPRLSFRIAGSGEVDSVEKVKSMTAKFPAQVEYLGHIPNEEISELYAWTDVVLIPSHFETANYVVLETGAHGKVAVASDIPGPQDLIMDQVTGYLIPPDTRSFLRQLKELYAMHRERPEALRQMGEAARRHIREQFSPEKSYTQLYNFLNSFKEAYGR